MLTAPQGKKNLIKTAMLVALLTLASSMGFFFRDMYMARTFGASHELDTFFIGNMLPMFLVYTFSIPAGAAFLPVYSEFLKKGSAATSQAMGSALLLLTLLLACLAALLYLFAPTIIALLKWHYASQQMDVLWHILSIYMGIMALSGVMVITNAALNAEGRTLYPALAQLAVPAVTLLVMFFFHRTAGVLSVAWGMLAGLVLNLLLVVSAINLREVIKSMMRAPLQMITRDFLLEYGYLIVAAMSTTLLVPAANIVAAHLPQGNVAIIGLGIKVTVLVTGIAGAGISTVLLPHFSNLMAQNNHARAQSDLSFFLLLVTLLDVPSALVSVFLSGPIASLILARSAMSGPALHKLIQVVQYGLMQLPFFACGLIMQKYMIASKRSGIVFWSSVAGFVLMLLMGERLADIMGVAGIALAMTLTVAISTIILVVHAGCTKALSTGDTILIIVNLIVCGLLAVSVNGNGDMNRLMTMLACALLCGVNWRPLVRHFPRKG